MPILVLLIGILLIAAAITDKLDVLLGLVKSDFTSADGQVPFQIWVVAIFLVGALGYYKPLRPLSNAFLVLVILALLLAKSHAGFITQAVNAIEGKK